jgi:hypothetical protein
MPPVDCLQMLSDIYQISINEMLSGERAYGDEFTKLADENLTVTLKKLEKDYQAFENKLMRIWLLTSGRIYLGLEIFEKQSQVIANVY